MSRYIKLLLIAGALVIVAGGLWYGILRTNSLPMTAENSSTSVPVAEEAEGKVYVTIDFGDGKVVDGELKLEEGESAFDALENLASENGIEVVTKDYDFGKFVEAVGGVESGAEKAWIYFVNGESGDVSGDNYVLKQEDRVEWKYIEAKY